MSALDAIESEHRQADLETGKTHVEGQQRAEDKACQDAQDALERAEQAESHHSFWSDVENTLGDVAKVAGAVATAAMAVATGGAAAAVLVPLAEAAGATAGVSEILGAGAHVESTHYAADAERLSSDAQDGTLRAGRTETAISSTIDDIKDCDEAHRQVQQAIQGAIQTNDETSAGIAGTHIRG
ncbi:MAG TPA: hypothetical protein VMI75_04905 [Polyangiaceae bacterium]|nr:hypothetical protein [Polyangiaceae bacterium]